MKTSKVTSNVARRIPSIAGITPQALFLVFSILIGLTASLTMPIGGGADEPSHLARVEQLANLQITPVSVGYAEDYAVDTVEAEENARLYGGWGDAALYDLATKGLLGFQAYQHDYTFPLWDDPESMSSLEYGENGTEAHVFSNASVNAPLIYAPYIVGFLIGRIMGLSVFWMVVLMRLVGLAVYILAAYWCIRIIPVGKWPLAIVAFLPATMASVSTVSADTVTAILAFAMVVLFVDFLLSNDISTSRWVALGVVSLLLPLAKMAYAPFLGFLIALPLLKPKLRSRSALIKLTAFFVGGLVLLLLWYSVIRGINTGAMWKLDISPGEQMQNVLAHPVHFLKAFLFSLPFYDVLQATTMGNQGTYSHAYYEDGGWLCVLLLCVATQLHDSREKPIPAEIQEKILLVFVVLCAVFLLSAFLVLLALYLTFTPVGSDCIDGVQARYFIPLAPLLLISISLLSQRGAQEGTDSSVASEKGEVGVSAVPAFCSAWDERRKRALTYGAVALSVLVYFAFVVAVVYSVF